MQPVELRLALATQNGTQLFASPQPQAAPAVSVLPDAPPPGEVELRKAVAATNAAIKQVNSDVEFELDSGTGRTVVRVIDANTRQVIRQMPSEEMLAIARALDVLQGLLIRQEA